MEINGNSLRQVLGSSLGDVVLRHYENLVAYSSYVLKIPSILDAARVSMEPSEYRRHVENVEQTRKMKHDAAISSLSVINRVCDEKGISPVFDVDPNNVDRGDVAYAIFNHMKNTFDNDEHGHR